MDKCSIVSDTYKIIPPDKGKEETDKFLSEMFADMRKYKRKVWIKTIFNKNKKGWYVMFEISNTGTGFFMTFENGLRVSVQFGRYNYCNFIDDGKAYNAEVAVINSKNNKFITKRFVDGLQDDVIGHVTADEVSEIMEKVRKFK